MPKVVDGFLRLGLAGSCLSFRRQSALQHNRSLPSPACGRGVGGEDRRFKDLPLTVEIYWVNS